MWFGRSWGAPICRHEDQRPVPVGEPCLGCGEPIEAGDFGMLEPHQGAGGSSIQPMHYACRMRMIVGGLNHQLGTCFCCGGTEDPDPAGLSRREAAIAATEHWEGEQMRQQWCERWP